uniref:Uncharacterized protein n=1 Tax=Falco tinnunculus TaxID=100819 RepID=A0A8C4UVD0_FALTI
QAGEVGFFLKLKPGWDKEGVAGLSGTVNCTSWFPAAGPCFHHSSRQGNPHSLPFSLPPLGPAEDGGAGGVQAAPGDPHGPGHRWPRTGSSESV